jgi:hypothetical protein
MIHLLGLAQAGYLDNGAWRRKSGDCMEPKYLQQCDISAPKLRAEEHVSAMLRGHDRRDDRTILAGETIRYERVGFHPLVYVYVNLALRKLFETEKCCFWHYVM